MEYLRSSRDVHDDRNSGLSKGRESYDNGVLVVVVGVTSDQGERESRLQSEAGQTGEMEK